MENPAIFLEQIVSELTKQAIRLEKSVHQTVCHHRIFQFACSQFRKFVTVLSKNAQHVQLTMNQINAYRIVLDCLAEYQELFKQNSLRTWAHSALENKISQVPTDLCTLASKLKETTLVFDPVAAKSFDPLSPQWLQLHLLDLNPISTSFAEYIKKAGTSDPASQLMLKKLESIDIFEKTYANEKLSVSPTQNIFSTIPIHYQAWRVQLSDFIIEKETGNGVSAVVYYGKDKKTGAEVAVKKLKTKKLTGAYLQSFQREIGILATIHYPTLLKFVGATETPPFCIVTEWMENESLYHDLQKFHRLDPSMLTIAAYDIARGVRYLHSIHVIHRDLKSLNILIDRNLLIRICDFGFSRKHEENDNDGPLTKNIGTPHWMAPELLSPDLPYDSKVDVYAYGIVLWEILTGNQPYKGLKVPEIISEVSLHDMRPPIPNGTPENVRKLITSCWARDPTTRPTFEEICKVFEAGDFLLPNADKEIVQHYIQSQKESQHETETPVFSINSFKELNLHDFVRKLLEPITKSNISEDSTSCDTIFDLFMEFSPSEVNVDIFVKGCSVFLDTSRAIDAANLLKNIKFPIGADLIDDLLNNLPTGNDLVDSELIIIACRNGAADLAVLRAIEPLHLKATLETVGITGKCRESMKVHLIQKTLDCLKSSTPSIVVAAIRCLVGISAIDQIPIDSVTSFLTSDDLQLRTAAQVVFAKILTTGVEISQELINVLAEAVNLDPMAATLLVAACANQNAAKTIVERLQFGIDSNNCRPEAVLRVLVKAAKYKELIPIIKNNLEQLKQCENVSKSTTVLRAINIFKESISSV